MSVERAALLAAVGPYTESWTEADRRIAAGALDVLWSVVSYERLVADWNLNSQEAIRGISWVIGLVEQAIRQQESPAARQ